MTVSWGACYASDVKSPTGTVPGQATPKAAAGRARTIDVSATKTGTRKKTARDRGQGEPGLAPREGASTLQRLRQVPAKGQGIIGDVRIEAGPAFSPKSRMKVRNVNVHETPTAAPGHRERVVDNFDTLVDQLMPTLSEIDPVPYVIVHQAQRRAALRAELLTSGAFTYRALAEGRAMSGPAVRQWVRRARERYELFTVEHSNETVVPAFLLDADLAPRPEFRPVVRVLAEAGEDGWGLWAWLVHPTPWLDGAVPAALLVKEPKAVLGAARNRADDAP